MKTDSPILYELSQIILAIPSTQVSVERLFSGLKFILSPLRYNIAGDKLNDIMIIRTNYLYEKCEN